MQKRSVDPRTPEEQDARLREIARSCGVSIDALREIEENCCAVPIERFLDLCFGPDHAAFYDQGEDLWVVPDRRHQGPGFGFIAIRSDRSWFAGVVPPEAFQ